MLNGTLESPEPLDPVDKETFPTEPIPMPVTLDAPIYTSCHYVGIMNKKSDAEIRTTFLF
jgi:hypothetical protein